MIDIGSIFFNMVLLMLTAWAGLFLLVFGAVAFIGHLWDGETQRAYKAFLVALLGGLIVGSLLAFLGGPAQ